MVNSKLSPDVPRSPMGRFFRALTRKKPLDCRTDTDLNRCLNLLDLTALGVGSTLGLGLYVLAGQVASNKAGPGVVVSFALAALASAFSALCYAEFAGRVPRAGSAFAYSYITVGEFVAFIIGWNMILEYVIGASSVARGFSGYLCFVFEHIIQIFNNPALASNIEHIVPPITQHKPLSNATDVLANDNLLESITDYVAEYFDWPSVAIIVVVTIFILIGVKGSTNVTMAFTAVNLLVVCMMGVSSFGSLDLHNWRLSKSEVPAGYGEGGFLPYGWSGVLAGSATCFFGFIGFDTIASSAEEAKNPKRNVPLSILLSLFISFLAYMSVAVIQTLLWPYYDQNKVTILPQIFSRLGMPITYWVVLIGAIAGLSSSQLGGMHPLPRILYSMAHDRLIYSPLAHINRRLKIPVRATIVGSAFVALLSCLLDIQDLADMVSIGTLAAYSLVSLSVLILRYEDRSDTVSDVIAELKMLPINKFQDGESSPSEDSSRQSKILIFLLVVLAVAFDIIILRLNNCHCRLILGSSGCIVAIALVVVMLMLSRLPVSQSMPREMFKVPLVPLVPTLSIVINTFLMLNLSILTWIRFAVWMAIGLFIYFTYGIWNSRGYLPYSAQLPSD